MKKKLLCVYHAVDFDGHGSGLVVWRHFVRRGWEVEMLGWNYGQPIPQFPQYDLMIMVDISFPPEVMKTFDPNKVCWIDHHVTAINDSIALGYNNLPGVREIGTGAVELAWKFFNPDTEVPQFVRLLSIYDTWQKNNIEGYSWEECIVPLQYGLRNLYEMKQETLQPVLEDLLNPDGEKLLEAVSIGKALYGYQKKKWESQVKNCAFPVTVAGKYRGICMLTPDGGSVMFDSVLDKYDIYLTTNRRTAEDGSQKYTLSMYAETGRVDINLGEYIRTVALPGAGGHACACGGMLSENTFINLIVNHVI